MQEYAGLNYSVHDPDMTGNGGLVAVRRRGVRLQDAAIIGFCMLALAAVAIIGHDYWRSTHNKKLLQAYVDNVIRQAEFSLDYATLTVFEVAEKAPDPCTFEGRNTAQSIVHDGGNIKDIIVLGEGERMICDAFPSSGRATIMSKGMSTLNERFSLYRLANAQKVGVGISWKVETNRAIMVALDLNEQLFASMPAEIRDDAYISLAIRSVGEIAHFGKDLNQPRSISVMASSKRFPISATLNLENNFFAMWNNDYRAVLGLIGALVGALFGGIAIRELRRPPSAQQQLKSAIIKGEIQPYAQSTFDLATREVTGCEILMRWVKPCGEIVSPVHFIPLAESTNMIVPMTRHVMRHTLQLMAAHLNKNREFRVAFNVVPADFVSELFAQEMLQLTKAAGVATRQVVLEITERQALEGITTWRAAVERVRDLGFKVALDDMGTGHNGLSNVQEFPLDVIKIDKKFVDAVGKESVADAIVELLVGLANRLNLKTIAEGIETDAQLSALLNAGVTSGQGYLVGRPIELASFIASQSKSPIEKSVQLDQKVA
jgi:c-di-GMP phosphodiesterase